MSTNDKNDDRKALDTEAIKLLKSDPAKYFESVRRQPFGFGPAKSHKGDRK